MSRKSLPLIFGPIFLGLAVVGVSLGLILTRPSGAEVPPLASYIPSEAPVGLFVQLPVGEGAKAWSPLSDVLSEIPGVQWGIAQSWNTPLFPGTGITMKQDVEPWLGGSLAVGILQTPSGVFGGTDRETPPLLIAVEVRDVQAFHAFLDRLRSELEKAGTPLEESTHGPYTLLALPQQDLHFILRDDRVLLLSNNQDTLKAALERGAEGSLANSADYRALLERLPSGGVLQLYISSEYLNQATGLEGSSSFSGMKAMALTLLVEPEGLRLELASLIDREALSQGGMEEVYWASLSPNPERALSFLPRESLCILSGRAPNLLRFWGEGVRIFLRQVGLPEVIELERALEEWSKKGLDLEKDLLSWMEGEWAFFLAVGQEEGIPLGNGLFMRLGLVMEASDPEKARQGMQKLEVLLGQEAGLSFSDREVSGLTFRVSPIPGESNLTLGYAFVDNFLLLAFDESSLQSFARAWAHPEERLSASEEFQAVLRFLPRQRASLSFFNLGNLWKTLAAALPPEERQSATMWLPIAEHFQGLGAASAANQPGDEVSTGVLFLHIVR